MKKQIQYFFYSIVVIIFLLHITDLKAQSSLLVTVTASPSVICVGQQSTIQALPVGGSGIYTCSWTSNPPGFISSNYSNIVSPSVTTDYIVTIDDGSQTVSASVTIVVNHLPDAASTISGASSVCENTFGHVFTVPPIANATSYVWSVPFGTTLESCGSNKMTLNVHMGAISGNMSVYGVNACGLGASSPAFPLTVNQTFNVAASSPQNAITIGDQANLTGLVSGGSGNFTYSWEPVSYLISPSALNTLTVPLNQSIMFVFNVTDDITGCSNKSSIPIIVTGGPLSVVAFSDTFIICESSYTTLHALPQGGTGAYSYYWTSTPPGFTSSLQSPIVSPTNTTQYNVTVDDGFNVLNASINVYVIQNTTGANIINGPTDICTGTGYATYSISAVPYAGNYFWTVPDGAQIISGQNTSSIVVDFSTSGIAGNITVFGKNDTCGCISYDTLWVESYTPPLAHAGTVQIINSGTTTTLTGTTYGGSGNFTYLWAPDSLFINPNINNPTTLPLYTPTLFTFTVTDNATGCSSSDSVLVDVVVSIPENNKNAQVSIFPNPTEGMLTINASSIPDEQLFIQIFNTIGKLVYKGQFDTAQNPILNLKDLSDGIYFINLYCNTFSKNERLILRKGN